MADLRTFMILQLKEGNEEFMFMNSYYWRDKGKQVDLGEYEKVYTGRMEMDEGDSIHTLDKIYEEFNFGRPDDYKGRSVSVSDIIVLWYENHKEFWFVDSIGFKRLEKPKTYSFKEEE